MDKVWATLRTLGILLALWVILAAVGLVAGVIPFGGSPGATQAEPDAGPRTNDAGVDALRDAGTVVEIDAGTPGAAAAQDAGAAVVAEDEPPAETTSLARFTVCPSGHEPSLFAAQLFGDERPELVVGCAGGWEVVAVTAEGLARIAVLTAPPAPSGQRARTGPAAVGDVDGDGVPDLVLPLAHETEQGASRGGGLFWVPRDGFGGIREPATLAPIAAFDALVAPLDAQSGAEIVALNRANPLAQVPSDAWVFGGGAAPTRRTTVSVGLAGVALRTADVDRDGHTDLVSLARNRVGVAFGDGEGAFPRTHVFELPGARELALGDLDGDGGADIAVLADGLRWIRGGAVADMEPRTLEGAPAGLRGLAMVDVNGDGKLDLIGWDHPRLIVLRQEANFAFTPEVTLTLVSGPLGPRRQLVLDLDADGASDDLVLLGATGEGAPLELVIVRDAIGRGAITTAADATPLPDAPLVLRATLPGAG